MVRRRRNWSFGERVRGAKQTEMSDREPDITVTEANDDAYVPRRAGHVLGLRW